MRSRVGIIAIAGLLALVACTRGNNDTAVQNATGSATVVGGPSGDPGSAPIASPVPDAAISAGSAAAAYPCSADTDCTSTTVNERTCCDRCDQRALNQAAHARLVAACRGKPGGPPACPSLDCDRDDRDPRCVQGQCVMVDRPRTP